MSARAVDVEAGRHAFERRALMRAIGPTLEQLHAAHLVELGRLETWIRHGDSEAGDAIADAEAVLLLRRGSDPDQDLALHVLDPARDANDEAEICMRTLVEAADESDPWLNGKDDAFPAELRVHGADLAMRRGRQSTLRPRYPTPPSIAARRAS